VPVLVVTLSYVVAFAYIGADSYSQVSEERERRGGAVIGHMPSSTD
jgi:hypothetical protein